MLTDLLLAIAHHLLMFALMAVLVVEMMVIKPGLAARGIRYLAGLDASYGILAGLILAVGFSRVFFGINGPDFYLGNWVFWAKIAAFGVVGLLSLPPTFTILRWRRALTADPNFVPAPAEMSAARRFMHLEATVFVTIPVFAALMARGYGT